MFSNYHFSTNGVLNDVDKAFSSVATVGYHALNQFKLIVIGGQQNTGPTTFRNVSRGNMDCLRQSVNVNRQLAVNFRKFFTAIITLILGGFSIFGTLGI
ncbi:hypothetical protein B8W96_07615 [Lentilactobacillus parakefiri]|nr:hypothetical protein B8W96_07615 [Lentilactobacillus parakefiri]